MLRRSILKHYGFLKIQQTPNPDCLSFSLPDNYDPLVPEGVSCEASGVGYCDIHPLSRVIFHQFMKDVSAVFIAPRSVSITKYYHVDWEGGATDASVETFTGVPLKDNLNSLLSDFVRNSDGPIAPDPDYLLVSALAENDLAVDEAKDSELVQCVKDLLRIQVRPMIMQDGGDIRLLNVNEKSGVVSLHMLGACKSCPSSQNTLKFGIERVLKHFLPEITEVVEVKNPIVVVTKEVEVPVESQRSSQRSDGGVAAESPVAMKVKKTFEVSPDDFEPVHKNEKSLYREVAKADDLRLKTLRKSVDSRRNPKKMMSLDELMEPDGD